MGRESRDVIFDRPTACALRHGTRDWVSRNSMVQVKQHLQLQATKRQHLQQQSATKPAFNIILIVGVVNCQLRNYYKGRGRKMGVVEGGGGGGGGGG